MSLPFSTELTPSVIAILASVLLCCVYLFRARLFPSYYPVQVAVNPSASFYYPDRRQSLDNDSYQAALKSRPWLLAPYPWSSSITRPSPSRSYPSPYGSSASRLSSSVSSSLVRESLSAEGSMPRFDPERELDSGIASAAKQSKSSRKSRQFRSSESSVSSDRDRSPDVAESELVSNSRRRRSTRAAPASASAIKRVGAVFLESSRTASRSSGRRSSVQPSRSRTPSRSPSPERSRGFQFESYSAADDYDSEIPYYREESKEAPFESDLADEVEPVSLIPPTPPFNPTNPQMHPNYMFHPAPPDHNDEDPSYETKISESGTKLRRKVLHRRTWSHTNVYGYKELRIHRIARQNQQTGEVEEEPMEIPDPTARLATPLRASTPMKPPREFLDELKLNQPFVLE